MFFLYSAPKKIEVLSSLLSLFLSETSMSHPLSVVLSLAFFLSTCFPLLLSPSPSTLVFLLVTQRQQSTSGLSLGVLWSVKLPDRPDSMFIFLYFLFNVLDDGPPL